MNNKYKNEEIFLYLSKVFFIVYVSIFFYSTKSLAKEILDYQKILQEYERPIAKFSVEDEEGNRYSSNYNYYDSDMYEFDQMPNSIKLRKNDVIKLIDECKGGGENKIDQWDLQIYPPDESGRVYQCFSKSEFEREIKLNKPGIWDIYLSVKDTTKPYNTIENWSVNGNHRYLTKKVEDADMYYWWYFTQLRIIVEDEENSEIEDGDDSGKDSEGEIQIIEHAPQTEISMPEIFYPNIITKKDKKYLNIVSWDYYDEDGDSIYNAGYSLYKIKEDKEILIDEKDGLKGHSKRRIEIYGEIYDKFKIKVWVEDGSLMRGYDTKIVVIDNVMPNIQIICNEKTYIDEEFEISVDEMKSSFPNKYLDINYTRWKIKDSNNKTIISGDRKINEKIIIDSSNFKEKEYYTIEQTISSLDLERCESTSFYVVDVLPPEVKISNVYGYYNQDVKVNVDILQEQSKIKENYKDYVFIPLLDNCFYEIYDKYGNLVFNRNGIINELTLNDKYNLKDKNTYKLVQHVENSKHKNGKGEALIVIKDKDDSLVKVDILERDNNPSTITNEIYVGESLKLQSYIYQGFYEITNLWYEVKDKEGLKVKDGKGKVDGFIKMDLIPGKYEIYQYAKDINENIYYDSKEFEVKEIKKPMIYVNQYKMKVYSFENIDTNVEVKDLNISEEHPNGYKLKTYFKFGNKLTSGTIADISSDMLQDLEKNNSYEIIQYAKNDEVVNIETSKKIEFYLENMLPKIEVSECDEIFLGDRCKMILEFSDIDGDIEEYDYSFNNQNIKVIEEKLILRENSYIKIELLLEGAMQGINQLNISVTDNSNEKSEKKVDIKVSYNDIVTKIELLDEQKVDLTVNKYIRLKAISLKEAKIYLEYENEINEVKAIDTEMLDNLYEDENIKIVLDKEKNKEKYYSLYIKNEGIYKFRCYGKIGNTIGKYSKKILNIGMNDDIDIRFNVPEKVHRNNIDSKAKFDIDVIVTLKNNIRKKKKYNTTVDILYEDATLEKRYTKQIILGNDNRSDMSKYNYITRTNALGNYYVICKVHEQVEYLPDATHSLYNELVNLANEYIAKCDYVDVYNIPPTLTYSLGERMKKIKYVKESEIKYR